MIGIINYGSGNIEAIINIYKRLNIECKVINKFSEFDGVDRLVLPGVGSFDECMKQLIESGLKEKLNKLVLESKIPILGICVGMHIMANSSEEGSFEGLGWIPGKVKRFDKALLLNKPYLPHMGWNTINNIHDHKIFTGINKNQGFYFVHSYYYECEKEQNILTLCNYGLDFSSSIFNGNIFGMQFHPEKSHSNGETFLKNFATLDIC